MDRLDALRAFVIAVERGSLAAAARTLRCSPASLTRAIDALETRVKAPLLHRTTRSLKLTEMGEQYLGVARRVLAELDQVEQASSALSAEPQGVLAVTAPVSFGSLHLRPLLDEFTSAHAKLQARLLLLDRVVHLVDEGIDVAIRIGHLPDSALVGVSVGTVSRVLVASPAYLERHGRPKQPAELAEHRCIASTSLTPEEMWTFAGPAGQRAQRVRVRPVLSVNLVDAAIASAKSGVGITCALTYQVAALLKNGALVRLLPQFEPAPLPVHMVYAASVARAAKVRRFVEFATPRLRRALG